MLPCLTVMSMLDLEKLLQPELEYETCYGEQYFILNCLTL